MNPASRFALFRILACLLPAAIPSRAADSCREADSLRILSREFQGLGTTREDVVRRELRNRIGEPFTCAKWEAERAKLEDLDIFAEVSLQTGIREGGVALTYAFRELPPYLPFVAVSKTEQDGLSLGPALASLNFLGQGIRAEFITRFGGTTEFQSSLSSTRLWELPVKYDFAVLRVDSYNRFEAFHEDSWRVKLDLAQGLGEAGLPEPAYILYAGELYFLNDGKGDSGVLLSEGGDFVPRLATGLLWDGRDRRHNPGRGLYQELRVTQNGGFLGGEADYREWLSDTRAYLPWRERNTLVLANLYQFRDGIMGRSFGRYDRFHAGGINTLRGYGNDAFQGKSELVFTLENRTDLLRKRTLSLWRWSGYYGLQGILGWEGASLWDHNALLERDFHSGMYAGVHLLIAGADRIRFEIGSKSAKFQVESDVGILDKADVQRFRAR
ncbi:MAG TPA: BamA/TamA family outer membrane protein [Fibrobacteria bacterium]|nr:BamA/TamA family outer membrane protein [Fibrobacteria bacterium]